MCSKLVRPCLTQRSEQYSVSYHHSISPQQVTNQIMNILNDTSLVALHVFLLSNAVYNVTYNFQAEDIERAPVFFRLAQTTNIMFSVCAAQIVRQMGPLRKSRVDCEPQAVMAFFTGLIYSVLTAFGTPATEEWAEDVRATESYKYMRSSIVFPLQAIFATVFFHESVRVVESGIWMLQTAQRCMLMRRKRD